MQEWTTIPNLSPQLARDGIALPEPPANSFTNPVLVTRVAGCLEEINRVMLAFERHGVQIADTFEIAANHPHAYFIDGLQCPPVAYIFARQNVLAAHLGMAPREQAAALPGVAQNSAVMVTAL